MQLHELTKITENKKRRLGRGHGSGRAKTSGRGTKGQKARGDIALSFEGGALPLIKRLPFLRGKGRNKRPAVLVEILNVGDLDKLPAKSNVDVAFLIQNKLVSKDATLNGVKILGDGEIKVALNVKLPVSQAAKTKIEKAGGSVTV